MSVSRGYVSLWGYLFGTEESNEPEKPKKPTPAIPPRQKKLAVSDKFKSQNRRPEPPVKKDEPIIAAEEAPETPHNHEISIEGAVVNVTQKEKTDQLSVQEEVTEPSDQRDGKPPELSDVQGIAEQCTDQKKVDELNAPMIFGDRKFTIVTDEGCLPRTPPDVRLEFLNSETGEFSAQAPPSWGPQSQPQPIDIPKGSVKFVCVGQYTPTKEKKILVSKKRKIVIVSGK
ncbi:MAG: hypothetical protein JSS82_00030 [Bacteroidetes bacterium]|nr:hypothetical protein [Bacteroidota bacterium]